MARKRTVYVCRECGSGQPKWLGQCPDCRAWNTLGAMVVESPEPSDGRSLWPLATGGKHATRLSEVTTIADRRIELPIAELNRVLGGGIVPGSLVLLGGEPGIGKSTLILQASTLLSRQHPPVLYVSGEESAEQIRLRAERMGQVTESLYLLAETNMDAIWREIEALRPTALVVDSIQTVFLDELASSAGSVTQVRECAARFMRLAKGPDQLPVFLVGHVTKSGDIAGPRILEHMVDTVLYLEGDRFHSYRLLRCVKNRFGSTNEVGVFEMCQDGLMEIANPSEAFLAERLPGVAGSAVTVTLEGSRPLLVEIQALVSPSGLQVPRRTANGVDPNRLVLLSAVLAKRLGLPLGNQDIFVNVVGGLRVSEPAVDLALATAVCSSAQSRPIPEDLVILGEVGLSGELRSVSQIERRLAEAASLGFRRALLPATSLRRVVDPYELELLGARTLGDALDLALL